MAMKRDLETVQRALLKRHGAPPALPATADPFHLILREQVGYLADDVKRDAAFQLLATRVGLSPAEILGASRAVLSEIAAAGGSIAIRERAERMRASAERVQSEWGGDLRQALRLPLPAAIRALTKFAMIGKPGAERILLLTRTHSVLALESNGLRVLLRLGYGREQKRYDQTLASVRAATAPEERPDVEWTAALHALLRRHGQEVCRSTRPACPACPLRACCAHAAAQAGA